MKGYANRIVTTFALSIVVLSGCSPDISETDFYSRHPAASGPENDGPFLVDARSADGVTVSLFRNGIVHAGYNKLLVELADADTGQPIESGTVRLAASAQFDGVSYEAPNVESSGSTNADGKVEGDLLLIQPSPGEHSWTVRVTANVGSKVVEIPFDVVSHDSLWVQQISQSTGGDVYVVWVEPNEPRTGDAPLEFAVYRDAGGTFDPVDDAEFDLYPYMDMGAGDGHSTPFTAPEHVDKGRYQGRINFIMAGGWDLTVYVRIAGEPADTILFEDFTVK